MAKLNLGQTIFFSLVILGLIALCVWVTMPDRAKRKSNLPDVGGDNELGRCPSDQSKCQNKG